MDRVINYSRQSWSANTALAGAVNYLVTGAAYTALYSGLDRLSLAMNSKEFSKSHLESLNGAQRCALAGLWTWLHPGSIRGHLPDGSRRPCPFARHSVDRSDRCNLGIRLCRLWRGSSSINSGFELKRAHLKDVIILLVAMPVGIIGTSLTYCASLYLMGYLPGSCSGVACSVYGSVTRWEPLLSYQRSWQVSWRSIEGAAFV